MNIILTSFNYNKKGREKFRKKEEGKKKKVRR